MYTEEGSHGGEWWNILEGRKKESAGIWGVEWRSGYPSVMSTDYGS